MNTYCDTLNDDFGVTRISLHCTKVFYLWPRGEEGGRPRAVRGAHGGMARGRGQRAAVDVHARVLLLPLGPAVLEPDLDLQMA